MTPIIINWNNEHMTVEALRTLRQQTYTRLVTVVVDNGSANQVEALGRITAEFPEVTTISNRQNLGYGAACNVGINYALEAGADYVMLLNNDVLLETTTISELVAALDADEAAGVAGPLVLCRSAPDTVWFGGGRLVIGLRLQISHEFGGKPNPYAPNAPARNSMWLTGTALLARSSAIQRVGLMDPRYFLYYEDVDWCCRFRQAGYRLLLVPRARIWHTVAGSSRRIPMANIYYPERNHLLFIERWGTRRSRLAAWIKILLRLAAWTIRRPTTDSTTSVKLQAYRDYLRRRFGQWEIRSAW